MFHFRSDLENFSPQETFNAPLRSPSYLGAFTVQVPCWISTEAGGLFNIRDGQYLRTNSRCSYYCLDQLNDTKLASNKNERPIVCILDMDIGHLIFQE